MKRAILDKIVQAARKEQETNAGMVFVKVEPWHEPVKPAKLLSGIRTIIQRFVICSKETAIATTLWICMTWLMDVVQVAPLAVIYAPEKRCGKTLLLSVIGKMSFRPLTASSISPAALYRAIEAWQPTMLIDEADACLKDNEELRGIINSGHTRDSSYVIRTVGDAFTPTRFNTWSAKAISGIGHLAATLMDRAITLSLRRKLHNEGVERLRHADPELFSIIVSKLARFACDYREDVRTARPVLPECLNDRAQDNWEPLLAIADVAGGNWPKLARDAALKLSGEADSSSTIGIELLSDIKEVFDMKEVIGISTADLIKALVEDDEKPWAGYNRGNPIKPRQVSNRLKEYGISSKTLRIGVITHKGYKLDQFADVFARYLSEKPSVEEETPIEPSEPFSFFGNKNVL